MKQFKNINYIIENGLIQISIRQMRRKAKKLFEIKDPNIIIIKNDKNRNEYLIDINSLDKFRRERAPKKVQSKLTISKNAYQKEKLIQNPYDTNISINIKSDDISIYNTYDYNYNEFLVQTIFKTLNKDLYYIIEQEKKSINHFHLHIGLKRGNLTIGDIKLKIEELLYDSFYISNNNYTDYSENNRKVLFVEDMVSDFANRQYISKGNDKLGGMKITFLNTSDFNAQDQFFSTL